MRLVLALALVLAAPAPRPPLQHAGNAQASAASGITARPRLTEVHHAPRLHYVLECRDKNGKLRWQETFDNLVTTGGKNDLLDKYFAGSTYTAAWKVGLKGTGTAVAADTLASHASWTEVTPYAGNRPALTWTAASAGSKSANAVTFTINATATVAGAFTTDQATGTTGILYSVGDFANARSVFSGDSLAVTISVSV